MTRLYMRTKDPHEPWWSAYVIRPAVFVVYWFSSEGRAIRHHKSTLPQPRRYR